MSSRAIRWDDPAPRLRVSVMVLSCGDSVQPAAEADQRAGGPVDVPDAVQQPAPAAQRPGVGQVGDGLLHQRAQPRLQAVERPLRVAEPVLGAAVPDRGVPVPAALGQPAEPAVQQGGDLDAVEQLAKPCQLDELVLVAAARPAAVQPQQVAVDGRQRQALGGVGVALEVVQDLLVGPPSGSLHPGRQPVHHDRLAGCGHLPKPVAQVLEGGDEGPVGLAVPQAGQRAEQQVQAVADLGLGDPDRPAGAPVRQPVQRTAATASRRTSSDSGGVPPRPGGRAGCRWARRPASPASTGAGRDERGQYDKGTRPPGRRENLAYGLVPVNVRAHRASRTPSFTKRIAARDLYLRAAHAEAVARICFCVADAALGVVCGDVGAGKTVAVRAAVATLDQTRHHLIYVPNPAFGTRGLYVAIVSALGANPRFHKAEVMRQATDLLAAEEAERHRRVVLVIDEAHLLSPEQLEELRLLTNADLDSTSPFAGILVGQPTLARKLRLGVFAALDQRIATRYTLPPMDLTESAAYLAHHLHLAGRTEPLFADDAIARLHRVAGGLPRKLNNAATAALIAAAADNKQLVDDTCAKRAAAELTRD